MTDVTAIIGELEKEILSRKNIFGKCVVEEVKVTSLLSRLREAIPQSFYEAQSILRQQEAILAEAERRADAILKNANEARDKLVNESEVLSIAQQKADKIEQSTQDYCENMKLSVHQNLDKQLYDIAVKMNEVMITIENLREEMWKRSGGGSPQS